MFSTLLRSNDYDRRFWIFITAATCLRLIVAFFLEPAPQETYYWNYTQHPALSYFDHPPIAAYLIRFFTELFGDNQFALHFTAVFISIILSITMYRFLADLFGKRVAFWSVLATSTAFIFALGSIIITPDGPLLLFWMLFMMSFYRAVKENTLKWWLIGGLFLGLALSSKYTAVFAGFGAMIYLAIGPERRKYLSSSGPYLMIAAAMLVFLPVIVWNVQNDFASFQFQTGRRAAEAVRFRFDYLGAFIGIQFAMLGLFLMPAFIWGVVKAIKLIKNPVFQFFLCFIIPLIIFFGALAPWVYIKMNWIAPAYLSGAVLAVYFVFDSKSKRWLNYSKYALIFSIFLTISAHILIFIPAIGLGKADTIHGWSELAVRVQDVRNKMNSFEEPFICGYEYKTASELKFHLPNHPEIVSNNIVGENGLAYDYWCEPDTLIGRDCIFVYDSRYRFNGRLGKYFQRVERDGILTINRGNKKITDYYIYRCYNYRGAK
ncbi:MAG: glycosyltransferase family 39 protein [candidate division Zixibacteria bacterium]|nr:glycosyltransferase family 39 protein [candidate division Zixibacteria bacterium]